MTVDCVEEFTCADGNTVKVGDEVMCLPNHGLGENEIFGQHNGIMKKDSSGKWFVESHSEISGRIVYLDIDQWLIYRL